MKFTEWATNHGYDIEFDAEAGQFVNHMTRAAYEMFLAIQMPVKNRGSVATARHHPLDLESVTGIGAMSRAYDSHSKPE